jgi:D-alanyl-D-alanine carboxypeptidase
MKTGGIGGGNTLTGFVLGTEGGGLSVKVHLNKPKLTPQEREVLKVLLSATDLVY